MRRLLSLQKTLDGTPWNQPTLRVSKCRVEVGVDHVFVELTA